MNNSEHEQLRGIILSQIRKLEQIFSNIGTVSEQRREQSGDTDANLDIVIHSAVDASVAFSTQLELKRLKQSLAWLDGDEAGYCEDCGNTIPFARLKAVPETRRCIECAEQQGA